MKMVDDISGLVSFNPLRISDNVDDMRHNNLNLRPNALIGI